MKQLPPLPCCLKILSLTLIIKDSDSSGYSSWSPHILVFRSVLKMLIICFTLSRVCLKLSGVERHLHHTKQPVVEVHLWSLTCFIQKTHAHTHQVIFSQHIDHIKEHSNFGGPEYLAPEYLLHILCSIKRVWCRPLITSCQARGKHKTEFNLRQWYST